MFDFIVNQATILNSSCGLNQIPFKFTNAYVSILANIDANQKPTSYLQARHHPKWVKAM